MALDADGIAAIYDALTSHAQTLGVFDRVNDHETTNPPGRGLSCSILLGPLAPIRASGLAVTSGRLQMTARVYAPRPSNQPGDVDRQVLSAACQLLAAYSGDFELDGVPDGLVRAVDLLGAYGAGLSMDPGWLTQDGVPYRVAEITLPLIVNDMWGQAS